MTCAFAWHSFTPDSAALEMSVRSFAAVMARPGDSFTVFEEEFHPVAHAERTTLKDSFNVRFITRKAMNNLCGPGAPAAVLRHLAAACEGHDAVWKVDSDALAFTPAWRDAIETFRPAQYGALWHHSGTTVARGFCYILSRTATEATLPHIDSQPGIGEDSTISKAVRAHAGTPLLLSYDPRGSWAGYNWTTMREPARYTGFSVVSFGNKPLIRDRRDAKMREMLAA